MTTTTNPAPVVASTSSASGRAVAALVLGILGLLTCQLLAPIAWVLGWQELRDIRTGVTPATGQDYATAGMVLGIIGSAMLAMAVVAILAIVGIVAFGLSLAGLTALR